MADSLTAAINDDHPLALELSSLRAAVSRYQHEAHATSLKLQRHSLEATQALDHARALERENTRLKDEVTILRANPDSSPTETSFQVPELTLALRRLSVKLTAVEETLLTRTKEVVDVRSEVVGAQHEIEAARALAAEACAREEEGLARERELERKVRTAVEERKMADLVVQEYADLVRSLEGRSKPPSTHSSIPSVDLQHSTNGSATTLVDGLSEGKLGLQKLMEEFNGRNERLQAEIAKLHGDNGLLFKELEVARHGADHDRSELAKALHELDKYRADDNTATRMVSRYMKFSQSSTDTLQKAIDTLKLRHASTLATLNDEIALLQRAILHERSEAERIRTALDELTEDIAREAFGRRREVSVRLAFLGREENLAESLRRWMRKAKESLERSGGAEDGSISLNPMALREAYSKAIADAETILDTLNGQPSVGNGDLSGGTIARLVLAQDTVASLTHELQEETVRRLKTERKLALLDPTDHTEEYHEYDGSRSVVQPVPHRMSENRQERQLLDASVSTTSSADAASPAVTSPSFVAEHAAPEGSIFEIITVPPATDLPTISQPEQSPLSAITDEPCRSSSSTEPPHLGSSQDSLDTRGSSASSLTYSTTETTDSSTLVDIPLTPAPASPERSDIHAVPTPFSSVPEPEVVQPASPVPSLTSSAVPFPIPDERPTRSATTGSRNGSRTHESHLPPPLSLEASNGSALSSLSPGLSGTSLPATSSKDGSLLVALTLVKHRYDDVQRGFRDCQMALKELMKTLAQPSSSSSSPADMPPVLRKAVERLIDFNEDARVELEIRIADEERVASGYEALLSIPGAMSQPDDARMDENEMVTEVHAFVDGSDRVVAKATQQFTQKLDDLQHDIASIKRTLHELALSTSEDSLSPFASVPSAKTTASPSWSAWTPSFLSPPRSTSPAPPTFGSVMTSPRLRHSSSFSHPRERSNDDPAPDLLASLGLRIVVPARSPTYAYGSGLGASPTGPSRPGQPGPRQRTTSGMFMLGLGMRSTSFGPSMARPNLQKMPSKSSLASSSTPRLASTLSPGSASPKKSLLAEKSGQQPEESGGVDSDVE